MYLFRIFRSFLPMHNPIGFGASDFVMLAAALLLALLLIGSSRFKPYFRTISRRTWLAFAILFSSAIILRLALLPHSPTPVPSGADDFSYLLLGDTLAHFRLANATHPLHQFFEAVFILQQPAYASIYPLGQGLFLAFGELLFNNAWVGVLLSCGLFCALCFWMLKAWTSPLWALAGALLAIIQFGPLNPWMNSYWGGYVSAAAGCLVFGALPRMKQSKNISSGLLLGLGLGLQILTRPFEALFLLIAVLFYLRFSLKPLLAAAAVGLAALGLTLFQNKAVTHNWLTMPYMESRDQYGVPATWTFQPNATPHRALTAEQDLDYRAQAEIHGPGTDSFAEYFSRLAYRFRYLRFFVLPPLYFALPFAIFRLRRLALIILLFALGTNIYPYFYPQYLAALTCVFILLCMEGLRCLSEIPRDYVWAVAAASFFFWFGISASGDLPVTAFQSWNFLNPADPQQRATIQNKLEQNPGRQLVFVRYSPAHRFAEWIHNDADIHSSRIVWANDLGDQENKKLLAYYPQRKAWLLEPDAHPVSLMPYTIAEPAPVQPSTILPPSSSPFETVH